MCNSESDVAERPLRARDFLNLISNEREQRTADCDQARKNNQTILARIPSRETNKNTLQLYYPVSNHNIVN